MENSFVDNMDLLDQYDRTITRMSHELNQATLEIAHLKFADPYTSVSSTGFKVTPAVRVVSDEAGQFKIQWQKPKFNNPSDAAWDREEQQAIEQDLTKQFEEQGFVDMETRFGNITQTALVSTLRHKFQKVLGSVIQCAILARTINNKFQKVDNIN